MAATLAQIRVGLAAALTPVQAASTAGAQASPYMLDTPVPPCLEVMGPDAILYDMAMQRGRDELVIVVRGFVGNVTDRGAQVLLDEWLAPSGPKSVKAALEADITLGGVLPQGLHVESAGGYRVYPMTNANIRLLGSEWQVRVWNAGT